MKRQIQPSAVPIVPPPTEAMQDTVHERRTAAHLTDPAWRWQGRPGTNDVRPEVAAGGSPQRVRARQTEMRTAVSCHARTHRRANVE